MIYQFPTHHVSSGDLYFTITTSTGLTGQSFSNKALGLFFDMPIEIDNDLQKYRCSCMKLSLNMPAGSFDVLDKDTKIVFNALDGGFEWVGYLDHKNIDSIGNYSVLRFYDSFSIINGLLLSDISGATATLGCLTDIALYLGLSFYPNNVTINEIFSSSSEPVLDFLKRCMAELNCWIVLINGFHLVSKLNAADNILVSPFHVKIREPVQSNYLGTVKSFILEGISSYLNFIDSLEIDGIAYKIKSLRNVQFEKDLFQPEVVEL